MASQLNIKSEEARLLAQDLARLTGKSMTEVIVEALRERLTDERLKARARTSDAEAREAGYFALIRGSRDLWPAADLAEDPTEALYDEQGLPR